MQHNCKQYTNTQCVSVAISDVNFMFIRSVYRQRIRRVCIDTGDSVADPQVDRLYAEKHHLVIALPS